MNIVLLILYILSTLAVGWIVMEKWFGGLPVLLSIVGAFLLGTAISVPATYLFAVLFSKTPEPILWGTISTIALAIIVSVMCHVSWRPKSFIINRSSIVVTVFALMFSTWMMFKTFHDGAGGQLFVGSNNVFDFGHSLGLIRSISWGSNIPIVSPFESGLPFFYHFFFYFWVAIWEHLGIPTVWAMNIPSILSFSALLIVIFYLPQIVAKQKPFVGWIAVLLTLTNSTLTFWKLLPKFGAVWRLQTYPFAGPFDGSTISIFMTLNNYVNQRHLMFSIALGLFLYILTWVLINRKNNSAPATGAIGIISGLLFLWNSAIDPLVILLCSALFIFWKQWKLLAVYLGAAVVTVFLVNLPNLQHLITAYFFFRERFGGSAAVAVQPTWNIAQYLWENLGLLPMIALFGYVSRPKQWRSVLLPFVWLFVLECAIAGIGHRGFDQKFLSFLIIGINALAAVGIGWLWQRRQLVGKIAAGTLFLILTVSGVVDLMPIKNEFAYPLVGKDIIPIISWIHTSTPRDAVFVSYSDIIDPVVLAGRTNFFGFFGNVGWYDRSPDVRKIYEGDMGFAKSKGVSYILVPRWQKSDFPYKVLLADAPVAYEDARYMVYTVK